jgi:hypothetical protein
MYMTVWPLLPIFTFFCFFVSFGPSLLHTLLHHSNTQTLTHTLTRSQSNLLAFSHFLLLSTAALRLHSTPHCSSLLCSALHCTALQLRLLMRCGCTATRGEMPSEGVRERGDEQRRRAGAHFLRPVRALILSK